MRLIRIGPGATLELRAAVDFSSEIYTRFPTRGLISTLLTHHLAGSTEELIIADTDMCVSVAFLTIHPGQYMRELTEYTGDNRNVANWLRSRKAATPRRRKFPGNAEVCFEGA